MMRVIPKLKRTNLLPNKSVKTEAAETETLAQFKMNFHNWKHKTLLNSRSECKHQATLQRMIFPVAFTLYSKLDYVKADKDVKKPAILAFSGTECWKNLQNWKLLIY